MPNAFSSNDFLSICLQSNGFAHMCCHMHFKVMIFWAFALKQMILYIFDVHLGGSICLWVSMDNIEQLKYHSVLWQCYPEGVGVQLPVSLIDNIEQQRDHSVLCPVLTGRGPSAFGVCIFIYALVFPYIFLISACESQWQHWTFAFKVMILYIFGVKHILM